MTTNKHRTASLAHLLIGLLMVLASLPALSCGPYFGSGLLEDRQKSLESLWAGSFDYEVRRLVPAPSGLAYSTTVNGQRVYHSTRMREVLEESILGPDQLGEIQRLYALPSAAAVLAAPNDFRLPESARHYVAGAVAWHSGDLEQAAVQFARSAEETATAKRPWPLLAQYMLGRVAAELLFFKIFANEREGAAPDASFDPVDAQVAFHRTRDRVQAGEPDPLSLGVASLGEEARVLHRTGDIEQAFRLYAQQAAAGDRGAVVSLLFLTRRAQANRDAFSQLLSFPLGRELAVIYAYTHFGPVHTEARRKLLAASRANASDQGTSGEP